ncbi:MAG: hypothetical protein J4F28_08580 [Nitrosopumilaceae archaeon]|nr:hypothetical protein [Nitrosopumilaceae archaeon]
MAGVTGGRTAGEGAGKAGCNGPSNGMRDKRKKSAGRKHMRTMKGLCHKCYRSNVETTLDGFAEGDPNNDGRPTCLDCVARIHGMKQAANPPPYLYPVNMQTAVWCAP